MDEFEVSAQSTDVESEDEEEEDEEEWDELSAEEKRKQLSKDGEAEELSRQSRGLKYEHELAADVFELTDGKIIPTRAGWSGNQGLPMPDLLIPFGGALIAAEIKTTSNDTSLIIEEEDIADIRWWTLRMSEVPVYPYLVIKFTGSSSRLLYATRLHRVSSPEKAFETEVENCPFDASITRTGNLSFKKPDLDQWKSTRGGDGPKGKKDAHKFLETLRNDEFEEPSVLEIIHQKEDYLEQLEAE